MTSLSPFRTDATASFRRRVAAMIATFLVHAVLLLLILWGHGAGPDKAPATTALAVFDVALLPPPVQITHPPPPPPVPRTDVGGSAGRARTLPRIAAARAPGPPLRADVLTMETSLATPMTRVAHSDLLALPDIAAATSGGTERGGAGGQVDGRGSGSGSGTGRGDGVGLAAAL